MVVSFFLQNEAIFLHLLMGMRKSLSLLLEQPSGSWAMKLRFMMSLALSLKLRRMTTWMGLWGHDLTKCSHLWSNHRPRKTKNKIFPFYPILLS